MIITLQYLEDSPQLDHLSPQIAAEKLKQAFDCLPITHLLIGWRLPPALLEACRVECERAGARFFRWHPLLTGDGSFQPRPEWQVLALNGKKVPGFNHLAEFTFVCPNHPQAVEANLKNLETVTAAGVYQGIFLDRIRYPSPAPNPLEHLGCFCPHCQRAAAGDGLDWVEIQKIVSRLVVTPGGKIALVQALLNSTPDDLDEKTRHALDDLIAFRMRSVTRFVERVSSQVRSARLEIGLDCFAPGLTRMVGQDLSALSAHGDWIKVMTYAHALGPAGLPFELLDLLDFLSSAAGLSQPEAMAHLSRALDLPLPPDRQQLEISGLSSNALAREIQKGVHRATLPVLAGMELVDIPHVARLNREQILADGRAAKAAGAAGLSISWDLLHIPLERLALARQVWLEES